MKYLYAFIFIILSFNTSANKLICSQLKNNTRLPFHYDVKRQGFHLKKGQLSPIVGYENSYQYRLLDGTITTDAEGVKITNRGHFSILTQNIKVSSRHHCKLVYLIHIYGE